MRVRLESRDSLPWPGVRYFCILWFFRGGFHVCNAISTSLLLPFFPFFFFFFCPYTLFSLFDSHPPLSYSLRPISQLKKSPPLQPHHGRELKSHISSLDPPNRHIIIKIPQNPQFFFSPPRGPGSSYGIPRRVQGRRRRGGGSSGNFN